MITITSAFSASALNLGNSVSAKSDFASAARLSPKLYRHEFRRKLRVKNTTSRTLTVYVQYYTKSVNGNWQWYPGGTQRLVYQVAPGKNVQLLNGEHDVLGNRVRLWAEAKGTNWVWYKYRDKDLQIVDKYFRHRGSVHVQSGGVG